ncbi:MAG TPA: sugar phosphate isomerase/epimerase [Bryobacteraceae bacterium]|nr:sugar phosphate isomerase/epimerase [Bryobacteraceae bacterium]
MMHSHLTRRDFSAAALAALGLPAVLGAKPKKIGLALQLYTVRDDCKKDLPGTIAAVGKIGYEGVEFAGYYDRTAAELRKMLDGANLKCCGTHIALETLQGDQFLKTVEFNKTIGNRNLIVPYLPEKYHTTKQAWIDTAKLFNDLADKAKEHGMRVGYHNHMFEFQKVDGEYLWDTFFGVTKKEVIMQFDTGNAREGGGDPLPFLKRYPGRAISVHMKEYSKTNKDALIGEGEQPWKELIETCRTTAGTEWFIVEQESYKFPPLKCADLCYHAMRKLGV